MEFIAATNNPGKMAEMRRILERMGHAEDRAAGLPRAVQIAVLGQRLDIERRLDDIDLEFAEFRHAAASDGLELILKDAAVLSLQDDLAQFQ